MADYTKNDTEYNYERGLYSSECKCCGGEFTPRKEGIVRCLLCGKASAQLVDAPRFGTKRSFKSDTAYKECGHVPRLTIVEGMLSNRSIDEARKAHMAVFTAAVDTDEAQDRISTELREAKKLLARLRRERTVLLHAHNQEQAALLQPSIDFAAKAVSDRVTVLAAVRKLDAAVVAAREQGMDLERLLCQHPVVEDE